MNKISAGFAIVVIAAVAQAAPAAQPVKRLQTVREALGEGEAKLTLLGTSRPCTGGSPCKVDVTVTEVSIQGKLACIAQATDVAITYGPHPAGKHTPMTWKRQPATTDSPPVKATYAFEKEHGLIVVSDRWGSTNGKADTVSDDEVTVDHKYKKSGGVVEYYPAVIQTRPDKTTSLCAAFDPVIAND